MIEMIQKFKRPFLNGVALETRFDATGFIAENPKNRLQRHLQYLRQLDFFKNVNEIFFKSIEPYYLNFSHFG
jgi:hypothetical protein